MYYVYILRCEDNSLYCGITTDVYRRISEHVKGHGIGAKYTRSRKPKCVEAVWECSSRSQASKLESNIKKLTKSKKEKLVNNPSLLLDLISDFTSDVIYSYVDKNKYPHI